MSELMSRCCRERRTEVPLTRPSVPPEREGISASERQRQEVHLGSAETPLSQYPQCIAEGANWST